MAQPTEAELAQSAVAHLNDCGYEVYQEVSMGQGLPRADIVGKLGSVLTVVECKRSFSLSLLDQCVRWLPYAHRVIAAHGSSKHSCAASSFCIDRGIGIWELNFKAALHERRSPALHRKVNGLLASSLHPSQADGSRIGAGEKGGGFYTPFRNTADQVTRIVRENPGITLKKLMAKIEHHYASDSSARCNIPPMIREGAIHHVRVEESRPLRLWPATP